MLYKCPTTTVCISDSVTFLLTLIQSVWEVVRRRGGGGGGVSVLASTNTTVHAAQTIHSIYSSMNKGTSELFGGYTSRQTLLACKTSI